MMCPNAPRDGLRHEVRDEKSLGVASRAGFVCSKRASVAQNVGLGGGEGGEGCIADDLEGGLRGGGGRP